MWCFLKTVYTKPLPCGLCGVNMQAWSICTARNGCNCVPPPSARANCVLSALQTWSSSPECKTQGDGWSQGCLLCHRLKHSLLGSTVPNSAAAHLSSASYHPWMFAGLIPLRLSVLQPKGPVLSWSCWWQHPVQCTALSPLRAGRATGSEP